jgi:hypothetical protein
VLLDGYGSLFLQQNSQFRRTLSSSSKAAKSHRWRTATPLGLEDQVYTRTTETGTVSISLGYSLRMLSRSRSYVWHLSIACNMGRGRG